VLLPKEKQEPTSICLIFSPGFGREGEGCYGRRGAGEGAAKILGKRRKRQLDEEILGILFGWYAATSLVPSAKHPSRVRDFWIHPPLSPHRQSDLVLIDTEETVGAFAPSNSLT
jgi:hypothetical protein